MDAPVASLLLTDTLFDRAVLAVGCCIMLDVSDVVCLRFGT